jgi:Coenzyme PQQ synthesis protein D (PqqD)
MISSRSIVVASSEQVSANLAGEAAVLNLEDGVYYGLDTVATRIWDHITEPTRVEDIVAVLLREYDVDADRCERELLKFLERLAERGLLEVADESAQ